jgi:hypothetical protein
VRIQCWNGLHAIPQNHDKRGTRQARPIVRGTLIRLEVERLPKPTTVPVPRLPLVVGAGVARSSNESFGGPLPGSPSNLPFAASNRSGSWTAPQLRSPQAADRWTWLWLLASVQLRLARPLVIDHRLPWQAPVPREKRTPARVRRACSHLLPTLGTLASVPQPCGRSPGRPKGRRSKPAKRFPAIKLTAGFAHNRGWCVFRRLPYECRSIAIG